MNVKLKAALLTLGVMLVFAGIVFVGGLFPGIAGMIFGAIAIGMSTSAIYLIIYGMIAR